MPRLHLFGFHDLPGFPGAWRKVITDVLRIFSIHSNPYRPMYPLLLNALQESRAEAIQDLYSGGSGPWEYLQDWLGQAGQDLPVLLTEK